MYLLIRDTVADLIVQLSSFTSHYVSINSYDEWDNDITYKHLHPTMYLLIPEAVTAERSKLKRFTSHYVSINSQGVLFVCLE